MRATDVHNHVIPEETLALETADASYRVSHPDGWWHGPHAPAFPIDPSFHDPAAKLARLDAAGVDRAILSAPPSHLRYDLSGDLAEQFCASVTAGAARFCAAAPDRLSWLATLPLPDVDRARPLYRDALAAGAVGLAVGTSIAGVRLDDPRFDPLWADVEQAGRPVLVHPVFNEPHAGLAPYYLQNVIGNLVETTLTAQRLISAGTFDRFPGLRLVLVHGGGFLPYQLGRLGHAGTVRPELADRAGTDVWRYLDNLLFDTITHDPAALRYLVERVGAHRVVLGSDDPYDMGVVGPVGPVCAVVSDEAARAAILNDTAAAAFGLDRAGVTA